MSSSSSRKRRIALRLGLALGSVVLVVGLTEAGLRLFGFRHPPIRLPIVAGVRGVVKDVAAQDGLYLHDDRQLWRPKPGVHAFAYWGGDTSRHPERVNERGYRGPLLPTERTPGVRRIATLGDSSTFGARVSYADSYSGRLPAILKARGIETEVLNGGVVGFSIRQGLARYRALVREHGPDVVVAAFGAVNESFAGRGTSDDDQIERNLSQDTWWWHTKRWLREHSRLVHLADYGAESLRGGREKVLAAVKERSREHWKVNEDAFAVDWPGVRRVSVARFRELLTTLRDAVADDGAQLVLLSMPRHERHEKRCPILLAYTEALLDVAKREAIPLVDGRAAFADARPRQPGAPLFVPDGYHPSPRGHAILASALADRIAALPASR